MLTRHSDSSLHARTSGVSANRQLRRLARVRGSGWSVRWDSHCCALALIEPCHLMVAFLQQRDGDFPSLLALP
jgi:hypothetical protein